MSKLCVVREERTFYFKFPEKNRLAYFLYTRYKVCLEENGKISILFVRRDENTPDERFILYDYVYCFWRHKKITYVDREGEEHIIHFGIYLPC